MTRLLLDTNVVVWLLTGNRAAVSSRAIAALRDNDPALVSAGSVWEIAMKRSLGKLRLADGWHKALRRLEFVPLPVTSLHAEAVESLPWHHRDPFDRLLVAQAQVEQCRLVTADEQLAAYAVPIAW